MRSAAGAFREQCIQLYQQLAAQQRVLLAEMRAATMETFDDEHLGERAGGLSTADELQLTMEMTCPPCPPAGCPPPPASTAMDLLLGTPRLSEIASQSGRLARRMEEETVPGWGGQAVADVLERGMQLADMRAALLDMEAAESVQMGECRGAMLVTAP